MYLHFYVYAYLRKNGTPYYIGKPLPTKGIPKATVQCPHCGKVGGESAMARWHFDNCKFIRN